MCNVLWVMCKKSGVLGYGLWVMGYGLVMGGRNTECTQPHLHCCMLYGSREAAAKARQRSSAPLVEARDAWASPSGQTPGFQARWAVYGRGSCYGGAGLPQLLGCLRKVGVGAARRRPKVLPSQGRVGSLASQVQTQSVRVECGVRFACSVGPRCRALV